MLNLDKIQQIQSKGQSKAGRKPKITDEQLIEALTSGLFYTKAEIAVYYEVSKSVVYNRTKALIEKGSIAESDFKWKED